MVYLLRVWCVRRSLLPAQVVSPSKLALERVKLSGSLSTSITTLISVSEAVQEKRKSVHLDITKATDESNSKNMKELKKTIEDVAEAATEHLDTQPAELHQLATAASTLEDMVNIRDTRGNMNEIMKASTKNEVRAWQVEAAGTASALEKIVRVIAQSVAEASGPVREARALQWRTISSVVNQLGAVNVGSMFESKAGIRIAKLAPVSGTDPASELKVLPVMKAAMKAIDQHMEKNEKWGSVDLDPNKFSKGINILQKAFAKTVLATISLPQGPAFSTMVYKKQAFGHSVGFYIGLTHFACMECRCLTVGRQDTMGVPVQDVPGNDMKEKLVWLYAASNPQLIDVVRAKGWYLRQTTAEAVLVPSGCFILSCSSEEAAYGVR